MFIDFRLVVILLLVVRGAKGFYLRLHLGRNSMYFEKKFLMLMKYSFSVLNFMDHAFVVLSKKLSSHPSLPRFSPALFPRYIIVVQFILDL